MNNDWLQGSGVRLTVFSGTGTSCKKKFLKENFQTGFVVAGGCFFFLLEPSTN